MSTTEGQNVVSQPVTGSSGLTISLHPLPILNISEHQTRARLTSAKSSKLIGALLGSRENRQISIVNSFELVLLTEPDGENEHPLWPIDRDFFQTRQAQCEAGIVVKVEEVFPNLSVVGWYTVGTGPTSDDVQLQKHILTLVDSPILLVFGTDEASGLPLKVYEAARAGDDDNLRFAEVPYGIETGEAERIAVDGVSRGTDSDSAVVSNLITQRNAIQMLHERITVLLEYVIGVTNKQAKPDHSILRQISSIVAGLPTMDAPQFQQELLTEYSDVQLTEYLTTLTKQLSALNDYADKHTVLHTNSGGEEQGGGFRRPGKAGMGMGFGSMRTR